MYTDRSSYVDEMNDLIGNGIEVNERIIDIKIRMILADTPGRSFVKSIKNFNGYFACNKCTIKGVYA